MTYLSNQFVHLCCLPTSSYCVKELSGCMKSCKTLKHLLPVLITLPSSLTLLLFCLEVIHVLPKQ